MLPKKIINNKKECTRCLNWKDLSKFNKGKSTNSRRSQCRECERDYKIMLRYSLTLEDVKTFWETKNCQICNYKLSKDFGKSKRHLCFDHNHKTGKFRGILCNNCNSAIGYLNDDIEILKNAINYLKNEKNTK